MSKMAECKGKENRGLGLPAKLARVEASHLI